MKHELYSIQQKDCAFKLDLSGQFELKVMRLNRQISSFLNALEWNITCLGRVKVYCLFMNEKLVHYSYVVRGKAKFSFLGKNDIEIGPCFTDKAYRGYGLYPYVVSQIVSHELSDNGTAYMIIREDNIPSIRGIKKVGFSKTNLNVYRNKIKRYYVLKG